MKNVTNILLKVFAREFYNSNAVLFLLLIGFCFGFMGGAEHRALAEYFTSSPLLLAIPVFVWCIYTVNVILFNIKTVRLPQNEFILNFGLLNKKMKWLAVSNLMVFQLAPVILYGSFLIITAIKLAFVITCIVISITFLILIASMLFLYNVTAPDTEKRHTLFVGFFNNSVKRHYRFYFIEWTVRNEVILLSGTKLFCYTLLWAILLLYKKDSLDARLLNMTLSAVFAGNLALIFHYHRFENYHLMILRNMPFTLFKRLSDFLFVFILLCLPEFVLLIKNFPHNLSLYNCIQSVFFGLSIGVVLYGMLYRHDTGLEKFTKRTFLICILWISLILYAVPIWAIGLINLMAGCILFKMYYYTFEYVSFREK